MPRPTKKKSEPLHIVRRWVSSPILFGRDSREMTDNPDFHPAVSMTSHGTFLNDAGMVIAEKDLPEYIRREAKKTNLDTEYHPPKKRELSLSDAMIGAGVPETEPDAAVRSTRNRRAAQAFA
jgi:hypothetical protein